VILVGALILDAYASLILSVIKALDRPDIVLRIDLVLVSMNVVLNVALVYLYGWHGAAVATLVSGGVTLGLSYVAITRLIGRPSVPYREIGEELVASVLMFACIVAFQEYAAPGVVGTVSLVAAGGVVYTVLLLGISPRIRQKARALAPRSVGPLARR
jgi:O-antigen/teichoic acid export membrane protein